MHIAIGSTNPVKQKAAEKVLRLLYPEATFESIAVASGVSTQPIGEAETRQGAINRARAAQEILNADLGIGLEGGVQETEHGMFTCAWCAVVDRVGKLGLGGSSAVQLPPLVAEAVRHGTELGIAMDEFCATTGIKYGLGAIGVLTNGLSSRQAAYEHLIKLALAPFIQPEWYS
ncbi:MAG: inosine/xanthosine triphosphatase [Phototrophicales bacterium]|nr:MAG: inosine/xanthosine triphosphatase [Phototrophicales bacterium]